MVSPDKHNPVVSLLESAGDQVVNGLVIAWLFESESAVSGDDEQGIRQAVLDAQLEYNPPEIAVDIPGDKDLFGIRIFEKLVHFYAFLICSSLNISIVY